jgi:branched-chain amino acid transport system substrate-binding protein
MPDASPVRVGVLFDFDQGDRGRYFVDGLRLGLDRVDAEPRIGRPVELLARHADGLPGGSAESIVDHFGALVDDGVSVVVGPSITDNGLVVRELTETSGVPAVNYTGGAITRGSHMFHYQVGSLEEEPVLLVEHLLGLGARTVAVLHDDTPVGVNYSWWLDQAVASNPGLTIAYRTPVSALADDLGPTIGEALATEPDAVLYLGLGVAARAVALGLAARDWHGPVAANSALMFGYSRRDWRAGFEGWVYLDTISDTNAERMALAERSRAHAASPIGVAGYDIGRLLGEGLARADDHTPAGTRDGFERVKRLAAASGHDGTLMGFGPWDHAALKGSALVRRAWRGGHSVEVGTGAGR